MNYDKGLIASFRQKDDDILTEMVLKAGFQTANLEYIYHKVAMEKEQLPQAIAGARFFGMHGFDLSEELQTEVFPYLDEISPSARITGRVNVVVNREGELVGENSEAKGLVTALLARDILPKGHTFAVTGVEEIVWASIVELAISGADRIYVCNEEEEKSKEWIMRLAGECDTELIYQKDIPEDVNVIVGYGLTQEDLSRYENREALCAICDLKLDLSELVKTEESREKKIHNEKLYYIEEKEILFYKIRLHFHLWTEFFGGMDVMLEAMEEGLLKMAGQENEMEEPFMMELPEVSYVQDKIRQYSMKQYGEALKNYCQMVHDNIDEIMIRQQDISSQPEEEKMILAISASFLPILKYSFEIEAEEDMLIANEQKEYTPLEEDSRERDLEKVDPEEKAPWEENLVEMVCEVLEDPDFMGDLTDRVLYLLIHFLKKEDYKDPFLSILRQISTLCL